ncbi:MAG: prephenate dehydrogenase/arogenate dehydrogenase family protein [Patescibacteria group bacterium]
MQTKNQTKTQIKTKLISESTCIVGYGRFGKTLHKLLEGMQNVFVYDIDLEKLRNVNKEAIATRLEEVYACNTVFLALPISKLEETIELHKPYIKDNLLIDVLSVKLHAKGVLNKALANTQARALLTHPMFGPDSSKNGFENLPIVVDKNTAMDEEYAYWIEFFNSKGLNVIEMSAEEHDRMAAGSQGVTHFVGRLLEEYGMKPTPIDTVGAKILLQVKEQTCNDTWELFKDLQTYNPFTEQMRDEIGQAYKKVSTSLLPPKVVRETPIYGIQGGKGSFNEQALGDFVSRHGIEKYEVKYLYTTERVLQELELGKIDFGQFAMHNSIGGVVAESIHASAKHRFNIVEEFEIVISHHIMKRKNVDWKDIKTIMAHPQVFKQCQATLAKDYPQYNLVVGEGDLIDHAKVAQALNLGELDKNIAVMGPRILAELYDLDVVASDLQDNKNNLTSFLLCEM